MVTSAEPTHGERPALGRRERKKRETRARILSAASKLYAEQGFDRTTIEDITEAADVSRTTFFKHFSEKSAVVAELGDAMTDAFVETAKDAVASGDSVAGRFRFVFDDATKRLEASSALSRALVFETVGRRRDLAERRGRTGRMHDAIEELLRDGVGAGEVRSDVPLSLLSQMAAGCYVEVLLSWVVDPDYPLGERLRQAASVIEMMVSPPERSSVDT
jgi:AcrR family transcriptional regulator